MSDSTPFGLLLFGGQLTHQENYARAFAADTRCRLIGTAETPGASSQRKVRDRQLATELGIPYFTDLSKTLSRDDVDFVCICADDEDRADLTVTCANAGKHIYADKEPAITAEGLDRVEAAIHKNGVLNQTFSLVRTAWANSARETLRSGHIGELIGLHCELFFAKGHSGTADLSRHRQEKSSPSQFTFFDAKRELLCVGYYPLVFFEWLTGAKVTDVYATTANYFFREHQQNDIEDYSALIVTLSNGLQATITCGRSGWCSHPQSGIQQIHLVGENGTATIDAFSSRLEVYCDTTQWRAPQPDPEDPMGFWSSTQERSAVSPKQDWEVIAAEVPDDFSYFLDCLEHRRPSDMPIEIGARAIRVILAAYESAERGERVEIV
ncbi:MAG: Gfo/Idh/MocA family oxidoreductase [Planctomycetota bacterium]|nr:Gfo/Idh/MocA family oxidoreductase [Planctomycetota bacterium]MDA1211117.1 Gfo/Idh/MocA family oxidoreductase [Planctomycetota bacterium]